jgi:hypothetical protein
VNKKGYEFFEIPMWLIRMLYAVIITVTVIFIVSFFIVLNVNVQRVDAYVTADLLYYSPAGLAYYDGEIERTLPGLVKSSYLVDDSDILEIITNDGQGINLGNKNIIGVRATIGDRSILLNKATFIRLDWLVGGTLTSDQGGPDKVVLYQNILFWDDTGTKGETLKIEAVTLDP